MGFPTELRGEGESDHVTGMTGRSLYMVLFSLGLCCVRRGANILIRQMFVCDFDVAVVLLWIPKGGCPKI